MECIATWSITEIKLGGLFAAMLRAESASTAVQMYLRLTSADARRSILDAAAQSALSGDDYNIFSLAMRGIKPVRERRNDFAHGMWGWAYELPDALLWISADDRLAFDAVFAGDRPNRSALSGSISHIVEAHEKYYTAIQVYREPDLTADVRNARDASIAALHLDQALNAPTQLRDATRHALLATPLLQRLKENTPSPPP